MMAEAQRRGFTINFDVLAYAHSVCKDDIEEEIGKAESNYIRQYRPLLNT